MKRCTKCTQEKELFLFPKDATKQDGYHSHCKSCRKSNSDKYREPIQHELNAKKRAARKADPERFKRYNQKYDANHKEQLAIRKREYQKENPDISRRAVHKYRKAHPDKVKDRAKLYGHLRTAWKKENKHKVRAYNSKRRAMLLKATPSWVNEEHFKIIESIYKSALDRSVFHERQFDVDHIEPLIGKTSCGLHVHWNLQVLPHEDNLSKGNKLLVE